MSEESREERFRQAFLKRQNDRELVLARRCFVDSIEKFVRSIDQTDTMLSAWKVLVDTSSLYAAQCFVTKDEFLAWAAESYDLYKYLAEESSRDPAKARALAEQLMR